MRLRFIAIFLSVMMMPVLCVAQIPTLDVPGSGFAFVETAETTAGKVETAKQVTTMQKTLAKIGSAKSSVSDFIKKQRETIDKYKEKIENYKKQAKEYMDKVQAYKAEAEKYINMGKDAVDTAKDIKENGLGNTLKENAGGIMGEIGGQLGLDSGEIAKYTDQAVSGIEGAVNGEGFGGLTDMATGALGDVAGDVGLNGADVTKYADQAVSATSKLKSNKTTTSGSGNSVSVGGNSSGGKTISGGAGVGGVSASGLVDMPTAMPSRKAIGGVEGAIVPVAPMQTEGLLEMPEAVSDDLSAISAAAMPADLKEIKDSDLAKAQSLKASDISTAKLKAAKIGDIKPVNAKDAKELELMKAQNIKKIDINTINKKDIKAGEINPVNAKDVKELELMKAVKTNEAQKVDIKAKKQTTPRRKQFKTSHNANIHNVYKLGFASADLGLELDSGMKTGETAEGVLIVPETISMQCSISYEDASKDTKMDDCLKGINDIATSRISEDVKVNQRDEAIKNMDNGYVEYLAAAYFEAMDTYNDSLTFKNNKLDPVTTTTTNDIDASWRIAKEMHVVLGSRINKLHQLWARALGVEMYTYYMNKKFKNKEK